MTSYLCKAGFSVIVVIKNKYHMKTNVEQERRAAVPTSLQHLRTCVCPRGVKLLGPKYSLSGPNTLGNGTRGLLSVCMGLENGGKVTVTQRAL